MKQKELNQRIGSGAFDEKFKQMYGDSETAIFYQRERYSKAVSQFLELFPEREEIHIYSAPGRTEIGGNHTDHQHGCVFAAAVNLDAAAVVSFHSDGVIRLKSEGYPQITVKVSDTDIHPEEAGTSASIIRGIVNRFSDMGVEIGGFDAYVTSDVLTGSGLSSSAAFEVLIGTMIDQYYNQGKAGAVEIAKIGQYAENVYFGKGSGLMDQTVSSVGGLVFIDFIDPVNPKIEKCIFDFEEAGFCICVTDTKGSHADLTGDYVSVPAEMKKVADCFGKDYLRQVDKREFFENIPKLRERCTDREILRAAHFFDENERAGQEADAIRKHDSELFLKLVRESGDSSANLLQNLYSCAKPQKQEIPLAIMMSRRILGGQGAVRVHGGGFAGTIQAFVPVEKSEKYVREMNRIFGEGSCHILRIRPVGGIEITE